MTNLSTLLPSLPRFFAARPLLYPLLLVMGLGFGCRPGPIQQPPEPQEPTVERVLEVAQVWAGHPVGFALLTQAPHQYVAYYDAERRMTVAQRTLGTEQWTYQVLPERVGWDSHNYIALALDAQGHLHLSGNMHGDTLKYFYATTPHDLRSLRRMPGMVGRDEARTTYPQFLAGPAGELVFTYRDGISGSGNQIYNTYQGRQKGWKRLLDTPLLNGEGRMNAYLKGPTAGPDGYYHLVWVWRDTPDAATNHSLSYARSKDLVHWEKSNGTPLRLPITLEAGEIIDPVPAGGGLLNGNIALSFDPQQRLLVTYHKYDPQGNIQIYNARREQAGWQINQSTDWAHRWDFGGTGTLEAEVAVRPVTFGEDGRVTMGFFSKPEGEGVLQLDPKTLRPLRRLPQAPSLPPALRQVDSEFPGMQVSFQEDGGAAPDTDTRYVLRWETLGRNRDRPRQPPLPEPSVLRLYEIRRGR